MTVDEVRQKVEAMRVARYDPEKLHGTEDQLHEEVLQAIADGAANAQALASEALKTRDVVFPRWYA